MDNAIGSIAAINKKVNYADGVLRNIEQSQHSV